jgi:hypothetical protein
MILLGLAMIATARASSQKPAQPEPEACAAARPVELGLIDWLRDFPAGLEKAKEKNKPLLLLFQEVPG